MATNLSFHFQLCPAAILRSISFPFSTLLVCWSKWLLYITKPRAVGVKSNYGMWYSPLVGAFFFTFFLSLSPSPLLFWFSGKGEEKTCCLLGLIMMFSVIALLAVSFSLPYSPPMDIRLFWSVELTFLISRFKKCTMWYCFIVLRWLYKKS